MFLSCKHMTSVIGVLRPKGEVFLPLLCLFALAGILFLFLHFSSEVMEGETHAFDLAILLFFRQPDHPFIPIGPNWLTAMMKELTTLGGSTVLTLATFFSIGFLLMLRKRMDAFFVLIAVSGGTLLSTLAKHLFGRERPDVLFHLVDVANPSFPSGHAMLSAVTYLTLGTLLARTQESLRLRSYILLSAIFLTLMIGISRIYLGVHWPTDVLGGWCLGALWAFACLLTSAFLKNRALPENRHFKEKSRDFNGAPQNRPDRKS